MGCVAAFLSCPILAQAQVKFIYGDDAPAPTSISTDNADDVPIIVTSIDSSTSNNGREVAFILRSQPVALPPQSADKSTPSTELTEPISPTPATADQSDTVWQIKVLPPDDMAKNPDLQLFVKQLLAAVKTKNVDFIADAIHPEIKFSEADGYNYGKTAFMQTWRIGNADSPLWLYLEKALKIGGAHYRNPATNELSQEEWIFPHVCNMDIDPALMYADVLVVTSDRANVRSKPDLKAPVIAKFSQELVKVDYAASVLPSQKEALKGVSGRGERDWYRVSSLDGRVKGYVNWLVAWNPRGLRLHITRSLDKWYISTWVGSGD